VFPLELEGARDVLGRELTVAESGIRPKPSGKYTHLVDILGGLCKRQVDEGNEGGGGRDIPLSMRGGGPRNKAAVEPSNRVCRMKRRSVESESVLKCLDKEQSISFQCFQLCLPVGATATLLPSTR